MPPLTVDNTLVTADSTTLTVDAGPPSTTTEFYLSLITSYHRGKARFVETVRASVAPFADAQGLSSTIAQAFDLDTAIGAQLDVDGQWIGQNRNIPTPLPSVFFSFGIPALGFGLGLWRGPFDATTGLTQLPDETYRRLLKARAELNRWDGVYDSLQDILRAFLPNPATLVRIADTSIALQATKVFSFGIPGRGFGQGRWRRKPVPARKVFSFGVAELGFGEGEWVRRDVAAAAARPVIDTTIQSLGMSYRICIANKIPSNLDLAVLGAGILPLKAMGARVTTLVTTKDRAPLFGFGPQSPAVAGFGRGAWGLDPLAVARLRA